VGTGSLSAVAEAAQEGRIERLVVTTTDRLYVTLDDGRTVTSRKEPGGTALEQFQALGVTTEQLSQIEWEVEREPALQSIITGCIYILPLLVVVGVVAWMLRHASQLNKPSSQGDSS
jgi:hypothetical protein